MKLRALLAAVTLGAAVVAAPVPAYADSRDDVLGRRFAAAFI
jgi:hypothetical protein